ncbi:dihydroneopterin aldolase [Photobacterium leiognathi]|uniref:dihydroneopterin aldolase n=1 Tax=Photobacterium leiognathi TaxID=553611 RepID=UPI002739DE81|nr:dihydroneopterin aldolase [Photobacterium leiognathi]
MKIRINGISALGYFGHHNWERLIAQRLIIDLELEVDDCVNDELASSVDYMAVSQYVIKFIEKNAYNLIETYAIKISNMLMEKFPVLSIHIVIAKPGAVSVADSVSVSYFSRKD